MDIDEFNKEYPVGSTVIYVDDFGRTHATTTQSEAWELCGTVVVKVSGHGPVDVERIKHAR